MATGIISVEKLTKTFNGLSVVNDLSFKVMPGEILGILGQNGAGKTTTIRLMCGYIQPTSGRVSLLGYDMATDADQAQRFLGYLPEGSPLYEEMTVQDFLRFVAQARGYRGIDIKRKVLAVVEKLFLGEVMVQPIETLSKGFKRRVGLAQALLHDPGILILDEPTDGLDPNQKQQVRQLLQDLSKDKIVVISTHLLEEVSALCTRAMIIGQGRILANAAPQELCALAAYHGVIRLVFAHPLNGILEELKHWPSVSQLTYSSDALSAWVYPALPDQNHQVMADLLRWIGSKQLSLVHLGIEQGRLDEVFRDITMGERQL